MRLEGTTALVTGAMSGLGAATVAALAARGVTVVGIDLPSQIPSDSHDRGGQVRLVGADVTDELQVAAALEILQRDLPPLRLVVNCAGIAPAQRILSSRGPHELGLFRRTVEINLIGSFNVLRLAAAVIAETVPDPGGQRGVIINTASTAAYEGQIGQAAYAASKGAIVALTLSAARDLARYGIRVNSIAPGIVDTPLLASLGPDVNESLAAGVPFPARLGRPDEFAQLVGMLAEHDYINGEVIRMDGALRMAPQ